MDRAQNPRSIRFGPYEADLHTRELRKYGVKLKLQEQPFQVLAMLLARPGELVAREEIRSRLWPDNTYVDFEHGLNVAVRRLRDALNDDAGAPRFVETLPRRGYRFIGSVEEPSLNEPVQRVQREAGVPASRTSITAATQTTPFEKVDAAVVDASAPRTEKVQTEHSKPLPPRLSLQERRWPKRNRVLFTVVVVLAVAAVLVAYQIRSKRVSPPTIRSLAVLPLQNLSGDPAQQYLADGITEELTGRLAGIRHLRVISRTSVMRFKDTKLSVPEIARTLGVDAVVEGSVMREGSRIRVHAQLIRAASDDHIWSESYDRELHDVLALNAEVAQDIASKIAVTVTGEEHNRLSALRPVSPEVYENYLKGKFALAKGNNKANFEESIGYFNEAIKKDPAHGPSYLGLASAYSSLTTVFVGGKAEQTRPRALLAARKALELDPELADAHVQMAFVEQAQWHWAEAEVEYRRALELRPYDAAAYSGLAWWLDYQGRPEEGLTMRRRARELDPLAVSGADLAFDLLYARHYEEAVQELHSALAVRPDDAWALWILGFVLISNHHPQDAIPVLEKGVSVSNHSPALVGLLVNAYAQAGFRSEALRLLDELKQRSQRDYVPAAAFVLAYLGLRDDEQAFVWLEQAYKEQSNFLMTLKVLPLFDPIRKDERFIALVHRVGLRE